MKGYSSKTRTRLKIATATATAIFSLASVFTATYAWFTLLNDVQATGMAVQVQSSAGATISSVDLIKFNYRSESIGGFEVVDYLDPSKGSVGRYYFNEDYNNGVGSFGYDDNGDFVAVDASMNVYDPVDRIIRGGNLTSLNCNAIYEVTFSSSLDTAYLQLYSELISKVPGQNQVLLSDCVDIDLYFESNLLYVDDTYSSETTYAVNDVVVYEGVVYQCITAIASAESFTSAKWTEVDVYSKLDDYSVGQVAFYDNALYVCNSSVSAESFSANKWSKYSNYSNSSTYAVGDIVIHNGLVYQCVTAINSGENFTVSKWEVALCDKIYYPSYKSSGLADVEKTYYKISYLASHEASHSNFYEGNPKPSTIEVERDRYVEFNGSDIKVYINLNYAPSEADVYMKEIYNQIKAIYDFSFDFQFTTFPEVGA